MKVISTEQEYDALTRVQTKVEQVELFEDFLMLSRECEEAAKAAYLIAHGKGGADGMKKTLSAEWDKIRKSISRIEGYRAEHSDMAEGEPL